MFIYLLCLMEKGFVKWFFPLNVRRCYLLSLLACILWCRLKFQFYTIMCRKSRQKYLADSLFSKRFGLESYEWQLPISPSPSPPPLSQNRCGLTPPLFRTFSDQKALPFTKIPHFLSKSLSLAMCRWFFLYFQYFLTICNMQLFCQIFPIFFCNFCIICR